MFLLDGVFFLHMSFSQFKEVSFSARMRTYNGHYDKKIRDVFYLCNKTRSSRPQNHSVAISK